MSFVSRSALEDLFRSGRFQRTPTLVVSEIGGCAGAPIEAVITDIDGNLYGECWRSDLEGLVELAKSEKDTVLSNPNLRAVTDAIAEIDSCRKSVDALAVEIAEKHRTTVVPFRPR